MIAIGNNEKCPFCELMCIDFKINGLDVLVHLQTFHKKEFLDSL